MNPNMHSGRFPAADRLCRQEVFHIPPHIRPEKRKKGEKKQKNTPAIVMKAAHLLDNTLHKCVTVRVFGKASSIILNLFFRAEQPWINRICNIGPSVPQWGSQLAHLALFTLRESL